MEGEFGPLAGRVAALSESSRKIAGAKAVNIRRLKLISKDCERAMYKHILIPTDGSPLSSEAVDRALDFAKDAGAKVTVLIATEPLHIFSLARDEITPMYSEYERQVSEHAHRLLAAAEQKAKGLGVPCNTLTVENAHPYKAIIAAADQRGCDLIAMASHGRRGLSAVVLGSETLKVLTYSKIPVLVYR